MRKPLTSAAIITSIIAMAQPHQHRSLKPYKKPPMDKKTSKRRAKNKVGRKARKRNK